MLSPPPYSYSSPPNAPVAITAPLDRCSAHQGPVAPTLEITDLDRLQVDSTNIAEDVEIWFDLLEDSDLQPY